MRTNLMIAALIYPMIQAVLFGLGLLALLGAPVEMQATRLMPAMIGLTFIISAPLAWVIAPRLRARRRRTLGPSRMPQLRAH